MKRVKTTAAMMAACLALACLRAETCEAQAAVVRKGVRELVEAVVEWGSKKGTKETIEELVEYGGREAVEETAERVMREGGEEAVEQLTKTCRRHGLRALRAVDNVDDVPGVFRVVDDLPDDIARSALGRLAAEGGQELAELTTKHGRKVLQAEVAHPGIASRLIARFGDDGADIALKSTREQATMFARYADELAALPAEQRRGVLRLMGEKGQELARWMGDFAKANPGKTLFTAATTTVLLTHPEILTGEEQTTYDEDGTPTGTKKKPGLFDGPGGALERLVGGPATRLLEGIVTIALVALAFVCMLHLGPYAFRRVMVLRAQSKALKAQSTRDAKAGAERESGDVRADDKGEAHVR